MVDGMIAPPLPRERGPSSQRKPKFRAENLGEALIITNCRASGTQQGRAQGSGLREINFFVIE